MVPMKKYNGKSFTGKESFDPPPPNPPNAVLFVPAKSTGGSCPDWGTWASAELSIVIVK